MYVLIEPITFSAASTTPTFLQGRGAMWRCVCCFEIASHTHTALLGAVLLNVSVPIKDSIVHVKAAYCVTLLVLVYRETTVFLTMHFNQMKDFG